LYGIFILEPKKIHSSPGAQPEISSKVRWKNIPYLGGGRGGRVSESLNQKNLSHVVFAFVVPPCRQPI